MAWVSHSYRTAVKGARSGAVARSGDEQMQREEGQGSKTRRRAGGGYLRRAALGVSGAAMSRSFDIRAIKIHFPLTFAACGLKSSKCGDSGNKIFIVMLSTGTGSIYIKDSAGSANRIRAD